MKKSTFQSIAFLVLMLCASASLWAQLGTNHWKYSNPKPFGFWGWQISYADDNTALVVGEWGGIAKTTDGGNTWEYFAYTTTNTAGELLRPGFNDVQFVNSNLAYVVGDDGIMLKSTNGGVTWSKITTPFASVTNYEFNKIQTVCFLDANIGYIGGECDSASNRATIYKTTNGGATWQPEFQFPAPDESWLRGGVYKIRFSPSGVGYATGANGSIFKYQNGTWADYSIKSTTVFPNVNQNDTTLIQWGTEPTDTFTVISNYVDNTRSLITQNYRALAIMNDTAIVVGTQNNGGLVRINTSTPQGSYWMINNGSAYDPKYYTLNSPQMYNAQCRDGNTVAVTSSNGELLLSQNKGFTWATKPVYTPGSDEAANGFFGLDISPSGRIGLCGQNGVIADSLTQWRRPYSLVQPAGSLTRVSFINENYGIAAGVRGAMMRTSDGGNNWEDISNPTFNPWDVYTDISYLSQNVLIAAGSNAQLYKSYDRGTSLDLLYQQPENASIDAIDFINEDTGWMVANVPYRDNVNFIDTFHQFIYRTTDGGFTWDTSNTVFPYHLGYSERKILKVIKFLNGSIGYAGGEGGGLYKTTDGGINWVKQIVPDFAARQTISSIAIVDANTVYVSGERSFSFDNGNFEVLGGLAMKTTTGGGTWVLCNAGLLPTAGYPKIIMYNASDGLLFGLGVALATKDGGTTWKPFYTNMSNFAGEFAGACFAYTAGCQDISCHKTFAVAGNSIFKVDLGVQGGPLPVKFSKLTGSGTPQGNQLFWTAFSQEVVSWFEIERSSDGVSFSRIGDKVYPGTAGYQSYQSLDANAVAGKNFYRIKAVERTGAVYYTNIVLINSQKAANWAYQQIHGSLILNNTQVQKGTVNVAVINAGGQVVTSRSFNHSGGAFNQVMPLPLSAKGIYTIKINSENQNTVFRILIQ